MVECGEELVVEGCAVGGWTEREGLSRRGHVFSLVSAGISGG